jgi:hypothetical protein
MERPPSPQTQAILNHYRSALDAVTPAPQSYYSASLAPLPVMATAGRNTFPSQSLAANFAATAFPAMAFPSASPLPAGYIPLASQVHHANASANVVPPLLPVRALTATSLTSSSPVLLVTPSPSPLSSIAAAGAASVATVTATTTIPAPASSPASAPAATVALLPVTTAAQSDGTPLVPVSAPPKLTPSDQILPTGPQSQVAALNMELAQKELQLMDLRAAHLKYATQSRESQEKWEKAVADRDALLQHKDKTIRQYD